MRRAAAIALVLILAAFLLLAPFVLSSYFLHILMKALIFALFAMSYDLLIGYLGLASLGHVAYFGIAAYTVALLTKAGVDNAAIQMAGGLAAAAVLACIYGPLSLRVRGVYFMIITLALSQVLWGVAFGWREVTGGDDGLSGIKQPTFFGLEDNSSDISFYFFALILIAIGTAVLAAIVRSPFGRVIVGIRENEQRMRVLGYNVTLYQFAGIVIAALGAGLAGILYAYTIGYVGVSFLGIAVSADALLMVILGGTGTLVGPAIGAVLIIVIQTIISHTTERWILILGLFYVVVVFWVPNGIMGWVSAWRTGQRP
jgi:branched-chain amino acid transport system permease protein